MRIAYTCHDSFPSSDTNTHQIFWTVSEIVRQGFDVELVTPRATSDRVPTINELSAYYGVPAGHVPPNLRFIAVEGFSPAGMLGKARFDWSLPQVLDGRSADLVWTRDPLAVLSCVRAGLPVLFETYRPDFATRRRFALWRRCLIDPHLQGVITHSQMTSDAFVAAGVLRNRCLVARNGFAPSLMEPRLSRLEARMCLDLPIDVPLAVYAGHVGPEKGTEALVRMAAAIPRARLVIVGVDPQGAGRRWVERLGERAGASNLLLRPRVPLADVAPYLYAADCLVIPPTGDPLHRFVRTVLPLKVFSYLAAGRPILAPRLPDIEEVLTDGETARLVPPDSAAAARALAEVLADGAMQERLGRNALSLSLRHTWSHRAETIARFLSELPVENGSRPAKAGRYGRRVST